MVAPHFATDVLFCSSSSVLKCQLSRMETCDLGSSIPTCSYKITTVTIRNLLTNPCVQSFQSSTVEWNLQHRNYSAMQYPRETIMLLDSQQWVERPQLSFVWCVTHSNLSASTTSPIVRNGKHQMEFKEVRFHLRKVTSMSASHKATKVSLTWRIFS